MLLVNFIYHLSFGDYLIINGSVFLIFHSVLISSLLVHKISAKLTFSAHFVVFDYQFLILYIVIKENALHLIHFMMIIYSIIFILVFFSKIYQLLWMGYFILLILFFSLILFNGLMDITIVTDFEAVLIRFPFFLVLIIFIIHEYNRIFNKFHDEINLILEEKDAVISMGVHDLKAPINRVLALSYILQKTLPYLNSESIDLLSKIKHELEDCKSLVTEILMVSRNQSDKESKIEEVNLDEIVKEVGSKFKKAADDKDITIYVEPGGIFTNNSIKTERDSFERILDNLTSNAIKYSPMGSRVNIRYGKQAGSFWIEVEDQGPGFTEEDQRRMYRMFQKLSAQPTGKEESHGLGLAIVKNLTDKLGGEIELHTEEGKGSRFNINFSMN